MALDPHRRADDGARQCARLPCRQGAGRASAQIARHARRRRVLAPAVEGVRGDGILRPAAAREFGRVGARLRRRRRHHGGDRPQPDAVAVSVDRASRRDGAAARRQRRPQRGAAAEARRRRPAAGARRRRAQQARAQRDRAQSGAQRQRFRPQRREMLRRRRARRRPFHRCGAQRRRAGRDRRPHALSRRRQGEGDRH